MASRAMKWLWAEVGVMDWKRFVGGKDLVCRKTMIEVSWQGRQPAPPSLQRAVTGRHRKASFGAPSTGPGLRFFRRTRPFRAGVAPAQRSPDRGCLLSHRRGRGCNATNPNAEP